MENKKLVFGILVLVVLVSGCDSSEEVEIQKCIEQGKIILEDEGYAVGTTIEDVENWCRSDFCEKSGGVIMSGGCVLIN